MDLEILAKSHTIRLLTSVGDLPGQSIRALITNEKGQPSRVIYLRVMELIDGGFLSCASIVRRGLDSSAITLTERGALVVQLLRAIEKI